MAGGKENRRIADETLEKALLAFHTGRFYEAESLLYKLVWTMELTPEDHIMARTLLGNSLRKMGRTVEAEKELRKAVEIANTQGKASTRGDLLLSIGKLRFRKGELRLALDLLEQALENFISMGNNEGIGKALVDIGTTHILLGDYEEAERRFNEAVPFVEKWGDVVEKVRALHNLAYVNFHLKDYFNAKRILFQCLELCQDIGDDRLLIHTLSNLSHTHIETSDLNKAAEFIARAGELLDRTEDRMCRLNVRWVQGLLMGAKGDLDHSLSVFKETMEAFDDINAPAQTVELILDYIPILLKAGRIIDAREYLDDARRIADEKFQGHFKARIEETYELLRDLSTTTQ